MNFIVTNDRFSKILKGGVIIDVSSVEEARIAEKSGACAVMILDMTTSKIRKSGGVARMSKISLIEQIKEAVSIPVMTKCRIGHHIEAKILETLNIDYIDESEILTTVDDTSYINKNEFKIPFVCGAQNLGEALRRIEEGATIIRTTEYFGTTDISQAVKHIKSIKNEIKELSEFSIEKKKYYCEKEKISINTLDVAIKLKRLPAITFAAGGIVTPADAALMMYFGVDGVFVGSGIFEASDPNRNVEAVCKAVVYYKNYEKLVEICKIDNDLMVGI